MVAVYFGHDIVVKRLLELGARCDVVENLSKCWPLHLAVERGYAKIVSLIIEAGKVGLNSRNDVGHAPIDLAITEQHIHIVKLLVKAGADVQQPNFGYKNMPLAIIIRNDRTGKK